MLKKSLLFERFRKFIDSIKKDDIVAVMHHTDSDGVCSGVIMAKVVERKRGKKVDLHINQKACEIAVLNRTVEQLKRANVNKLIITDLGVDQAPSNIKEIEKFAEILVMDHHKIYANIDSKKTLFLKPQLVSQKNPAAYTAAKFCFDMASEILDMSDLDWVAAVGLIGDCAFNLWKDFLEGVFSKYGIEKKANIFETDLGKASSIISDAECFDSANAYKAFDIVYGSSSPSDVLKSELLKYHETVESETMYWMEHVNEFAEFIDDAIIYLIKPKYQIKPALSTRLSLKYSNKTIIILQDFGDGMIGISARRRDEKVAVNELLEKATAGLERANAGGHIPAAGGRIRKDDLSKFKDNLLHLVSKHG